jgi:hypothetical protein
MIFEKFNKLISANFFSCHKITPFIITLALSYLLGIKTDTPCVIPLQINKFAALAYG